MATISQDVSIDLGVEFVRTHFTIAANDDAFLDALAPTGKTVVGGGVELGDFNMVVLEAYPNGSQYHVRIVNQNAYPVDVWVHAAAITTATITVA